MLHFIWAGGAMAEASDAKRAEARANGDFVAERHAQRTAKTGRCMQLAGLPLVGPLAAAGYGAYCYSQGYFDEIPEENA